MRLCPVICAALWFLGCASSKPPPDHPEGACSGDRPCAADAAPSRCADDMVLVADRFCIDRYEASMVDAGSGRSLSPYHPPSLKEMQRAVVGQTWGPAAVGKAKLEPPVPLLPEWQRSPGVQA